MVFESVVADILNKFLGDYVENLDRSQLKIGIWGGDVSLKNLTLKPSALDDLNLPIKTIYGHLGKLILKIPWKNIYTAPVEVSVENLFLLVNPIQDISYDPEKEEKLLQEIKQSLINKVELAKKAEKEKDGPKVDDTFVEKLAAQIIKNVQIFIQEIHIRYEDRITKPECPFSVGMSLHTLKVYTTNESCDRYILPQETSPIFYKIMVMEGLSLYWNNNSVLFMDFEKKDDIIIKMFIDNIATKNRTPPDYQYILGPINSEAKLQINSKPENVDFITPKMFFSLVLETLLIHLNRSQYQDMISLIETFDRMSKSAPYLKYRPNLKEYKGHYKEWWKFAITCILEEEVKRKYRNWDWNVIKNHRNLIKRYQVVYRLKLTEKITENIKKELASLEHDLDAFNIILLRQKVENEIEREGKLIAEEKTKKSGWFSGWFSSSNAQRNDVSDDAENSDLVKKIENVMTDEEKEKLFRAIGYHESVSPALYPKSYIAIRLEFILRVLRIVITDDYSNSIDNPRQEENDSKFKSTVLCIEFREAFVAIHQRPAAQSFALTVKMQSFQTLGLCQNGIVPQIIKSKLNEITDRSPIFLDVFFETNPEGDNYDQRLYITLRPLKIVYDAQTVIRILEILTPERDISNVKNQLQAAANIKLEEMKEKSAARFQYAIEKSTKLDLKIDLMAPYLIIPFGGFYTKNELKLIINLGRITIESKSTENVSYNLKKMISDGQSQDQILSQIIAQCYDRFSICLSEMQVLSLEAGKSWRPSIGPEIKSSINHDVYILQPTSIYINIYKCLIDDDPRLPKIKIDGNLPDVTIKITEKKLLEVISLIISLPFPKNSSVDEESEAIVKEEFGSTLSDSSLAFKQKLESVNKLQISTLKKYRRSYTACSSQNKAAALNDKTSLMDFINLEANFNLNVLTMYVTCETSDIPFIEASVKGIELNFIQRMYSCEIISKLGMISLTQTYNNTIIPTVSTPLTKSDEDEYLFYSKLLIADKNTPMFYDTYNSTAISLEVAFSKLYVIAHQEAILNTIQWVNNLQNQILLLLNEYKGNSSNEQKLESVKHRKNSTSSNTSTYDTRRKKLKTKSSLTAIIEDQLSDTNTMEKRKSLQEKLSEITELKVSVKLSVIQMCLQTMYRPLVVMDIDNFIGSVILKKSNTQIDVVLQSISVRDLNPETIYNKVVYIAEGKNALKIKTVICNTEEESNKHNNFDILVTIHMNCLQCVFINEFIMDVVKFMNNFQTSKEMIAEASAAAVNSAKMNVQQVYQSSTKISLDIFADAPVAIIPRNKRSSEIFIVDFGNLSVTNTLKFLNSDSVSRDPSIDEIFVNLENMKVVRTNYERTISECLLLQPVNYTLVIKRNLSTSWPTDIPDFDIDGKFCPIYITITHEDYKLLMKTLSENINSEPDTKSSESYSTVTKDNAKVETEIAQVECQETENTDLIYTESKDISSEPVRNMIKFSMEVESVSIDLIFGFDEMNQVDGLAKFTLFLLCVNGSMQSNGNISVHAFLSNCYLEDTRLIKKNNEVKEYMHRKKKDEITSGFLPGQSYFSDYKDENEVCETSTSSAIDSESRSMIDITFEKEAFETYINAHIFSFVLILNVDHLIKIQEFFLSEFELENTGHTNVNDISRRQPVKQIIELPKDQPNENSLSVQFITITTEKSDIILVENLDDINTKAIILNNEGNLKIQFANDGNLSVTGFLKNLQLYSCCYNPEKRNQTSSLIVHPITVNLTGSTLPVDKSLHFNMNATELIVSVTAGTIEVLAKILSTLMPNKENECKPNNITLTDYSNIWQQNLLSDNYWFLQTEIGIDISSEMCYLDENIALSENSTNKVDIILIAVPVIQITLEAGVGKKTLPLLALRSSFQGTLTRSLKETILNSSISLEMGYYNSRLALWEPIIEPVHYFSPDSCTVSQSIPWQLQMNLQISEKYNNVNPILSASIDNELNSNMNDAEPAIAVSITSQERIELTVTKTCMDVIRTLSNSFNNAVSLKCISNTGVLSEIGFSCYKLINDFGVDVILCLKPDQPFRIAKIDPNESFCENFQESVRITAGETVNLLMKKDQNGTVGAREQGQLCLLDKLNSITGQHLFFNIMVPDKNKSLMLPVSRADKRFFSLRSQSSTNKDDSWGLISEIEVVEGSVITTLRSVIRIFNHFAVNISVYYMKNEKDKTELCEIGQVGPSQHLNLPVQAVYSSKYQLYFAPEKFLVSSEAFVWKDLQKTVSLIKQLQCQSRNPENEDPFFIIVLGEMEQVYYENTMSCTLASTSYNIHLRPTLIFKNCLPINIICCLQGIGTEHILKPGERINVSTAEPDHSTIVLRLDNYLDRVWSCKKIIKSDTPVFSVWAFYSYDSEKQFSLNLGVWYSNSNNSMIFTLYCPFWMLNKTGLNLSYKGVEDDGMILHHPNNFDEPILFSFKEKSFFSKKKACVRVNDGDWSDKFSIDAAGSSGSVFCPYRNAIYQLGIYIKLNYNSLTKQVIFSPFYTIINNCPYAVEIRESFSTNKEWNTIQSEACFPFWPTIKDDKKKVLELRISGTNEITTSFSYFKIKTYSLMLLNKFGGIHVDVQVTEGGIYIALSPFQPKMAPALIINDTNTCVELIEVDLCDSGSKTHNSLLPLPEPNNYYRKWTLDPGKEILFTWCSTYAEKPVLLINKSPKPVDLKKDGVGEFSYDQNNKNYWISFLDGMQRILLITSNASIIKQIEAVADFVQVQQEIIISLEGLGFSLVNNVSKQELLYVSISSSGIQWEIQKKPGKRFKSIKKYLNFLLEEAYLNYCNMSKLTDDNLNIDQEINLGNDSKMIVNFSKNLILQPMNATIRRTYNSGLWLQIKSSEHYKQIHAKIHRLQIDNQIYDCVFPIIFFPVPPPKSVAVDEGMEKPFAELSVVQRINECSTVNQFKYFKILIQEFHVKADIGFINSLVKFFETNSITDEEETILFNKDQQVVKEPLCVHISSLTSQDFYDLLHFSPLKIHISFSLSGENPNNGTPQEGLHIVNLLTQSIGVTLTDVHDVVFRLAYFERKHTFYSQTQLIAEVKTHYIGQFVKQLYVLVLGLDVLGNPFGLVTGLKQGVEDFFYEPFQGAIQGSDEFAEGVLLGFRSLFGHTVGGAVGAVGRITGAMGKGLAALTLDESYQKKRRQRLAHQQQSIKEGGRGLVMGVVEGVGGVICKPISGAREEGVEGFLKGVGKGTVGLFMRPASGVVDFASGTVDVVRRATTFSEEIRRYRLPRLIKENGLVLPYSKKDAEGFKLLLDSDKGKYINTDNYIFHFPINIFRSDKEIVLLTDNRILYLMKTNDIFSDNIKVEWQYTWQKITLNGLGETENGIFLRPTNTNHCQSSSGIKSLKSIFQSTDKGKIILISDENLRKWVLQKMKELIKAQTSYNTMT